jgi:hypothetical protein
MGTIIVTGQWTRHVYAFGTLDTGMLTGLVTVIYCTIRNVRSIGIRMIGAGTPRPTLDSKLLRVKSASYGQTKPT